MFRIGILQRFSVSAARQLATVPRNFAPLTSNLRMDTSLSPTLSKLKSLHLSWPTQPQWIPVVEPVQKREPAGFFEELENDNTLHMDSVLRKRRLKMKKHKLRKRRRLQRSLKKRLGNINKKAEVVAILGGVESEKGSKVGNHYLVNQSLDIEEVQGSIDEVTIHKAKSAAKLIGGPVLVEDTCLAFNAFNDLPGPYIKWFVQGVGLQGLVDMLYKFEDKSAKAVCTFGYCEGPDQEVKLFQGITHGKIVESRGHKNFGWDSIFQPDGFEETYAELDKSVKNGISHRYKALKKFQDFLLGNGSN